MFSTKIYLAISMFCFSIIIFSCRPNDHESRKERFYIECKIDSIKIKDGFKHVLVKTKLTNNTPKTITYINYNCSWADAYLTDNKELYVDGNICNHNFPHEYYILSDSSEKERIIKVLSENKKTISGMKFRIGFIHIPFRSFETFDEDAKKLHIDSIINKNTKNEIHYWLKNDKADIVWSDTLTVP